MCFKYEDVTLLPTFYYKKKYSLGPPGESQQAILAQHFVRAKSESEESGKNRCIIFSAFFRNRF
jgi:hypothetical protein